MTTIQKVALAGATGNLGPAILRGLIDGGFQVTVLTRQSSTHTFPSGVTAISVDYDSLDSLVSALRGQDALISTLGAAGMHKQLLLVEAAAKAGVKRFMPSEFGSDTLNASNRTLSLFQEKATIQDAAKKHADAFGMTYTFLITGPFLDWGLRIPFLMNLKAKSVTYYDDPAREFSTTALPDIGKAVAAVLKKPEETRNRAVYVQSAQVSLKQLVDIAKKSLGADGWKEDLKSVDSVREEGIATESKPGASPGSGAMNFIFTSIFGKSNGGQFKKVDNDLLGLPQLTESQLEDLVTSLTK